MRQPAVKLTSYNPETSEVTPSDTLNTSHTTKGLGIHNERIEDPDMIIPAIKRGIKTNQYNKPAFLETICAKYPAYGQ